MRKKHYISKKRNAKAIYEAAAKNEQETQKHNAALRNRTQCGCHIAQKCNAETWNARNTNTEVT